MHQYYATSKQIVMETSHYICDIALDGGCFNFMLLPPLERCWICYVFGLSIHAYVRSKSLWTQHITFFGKFHQIYNFGLLVDREACSQPMIPRGNGISFATLFSSPSLASLPFLILIFPSPLSSGQPVQLGGLGSAVSFPSKVWSRAPTAKAFWYLLS